MTESKVSFDGGKSIVVDDFTKRIFESIYRGDYNYLKVDSFTKKNTVTGLIYEFTCVMADNYTATDLQ